jgi:L-lactate dehydrogenase complex protein LldF
MSLAEAKPDFHHTSERFLANRERTGWHDATLWFVRSKRDKQAAATPDWERLREHAAKVKAHVLDHLPELLASFAQKARERGWQVHFAGDGHELCGIVHGLLAKKNVRKLVKSKSMLTEECGLNPFLYERGIEVVDTDLGERIVQLRHEPPSHIVLPAIHLKREEVGELFHREMGAPKGEKDPTKLAGIARADLRKRFLEAEAGITGVNFAVAETGSIVLCTNEGNADLGTALPPLHIACMGVEKLVPVLSDVPVFLRLLARSATGQPITSYSTHITGPDPLRPGHEAHIVIVDNGRAGMERDGEHRRALSCIRCGACMNTCPIYRRSGGYSYGWTVPGPIGAVLGPAMIGTDKAKELPFASTLCGSCTNVCPVKIDLHEQLLSWRARVASDGHVPFAKRLAMRIGAQVMNEPWLYALGGWFVRKLWPLITRLPGGPLEPWTRTRDLPPAPEQSFRGWWRDQGRNRG